MNYYNINELRDHSELAIKIIALGHEMRMERINKKFYQEEKRIVMKYKAAKGQENNETEVEAIVQEYKNLIDERYNKAVKSYNRARNEVIFLIWLIIAGFVGLWLYTRFL